MITYTLAKLILQGITENAEKEYATYLQNYLKRLTLLYERGKISEKDYRKLESQASERIKVFLARSKTAKQRYMEIRF